MKQSLKILHLEDSVADAELVKETLISGGIDCDIVRVDSYDDFIHALDTYEFDIILLDYSLPTFDGLAAIEVIKEKSPDIPTIFVTGSMGEELAIETLKSGATDYVLKESLGRLLPSVNRALTEAEDHKMRFKAEEAKKESEARYRRLIENAPDVIFSLGSDKTILSLSPAFENLTGWSRDEWLQKPFVPLIHPEDISLAFEKFQQVFRGETPSPFELRFLSKNGDYLFSEMLVTPWIRDGKVIEAYGIARDVTERKIYELKLKKSADEWRKTFDSMNYGVMLLDKDFSIIRANKYISGITGVPILEIKGKKCFKIFHGLDKPIDGCPCLNTLRTLSTSAVEIYEPRLDRHFYMSTTPFLDEKGNIQSYIHSVIDVTDNKEKERKIVESRDAFLNMLKDLDFSYKELREVYQGLIVSFVNALDAKSPWTKGHSVRVTNYAVTIAKELGLKESEIEPLNTAALLHDIGKIGTYDTLLDKPGRLTDEEFALVKLHPGKGADILKPIRQFQAIIPIIRHHHERLDGKGYPDGLEGEKIPLLSRIIHVADSFDAMTADRPYRKAPGREFAISELKKWSGLQFDPDAAKAFIRYLDRTPEEKKETMQLRERLG